MIATLKVDYPNELIEMLLKSKSGAIAANVIAPLFIFYILQDFVPLTILYTLTLTQVFSFILRMIISHKMLSILKIADKKTIHKHLKQYLFLIGINAFLLGTSGTLAIIYAPELQVYMLIALVFALIAGAMSTLAPVYHAVLIYFMTILPIFILSLIFIGSTNSYYFIALMICFYIIVSISSSLRIHNALRKSIDQKEEIKVLNASLEEKIVLRTKELEEKTIELETLNRSLDERVKQESAKLHKNEQLLIQQSRQAAMGEMIGNIAHQWRQPLNAIGLIIQNIQLSYYMDDLNDEFMEESTSKGNALVQSMSKTIDDFRDFFKPNKEKETFKIEEIINQSIELVSAAYTNNFIEIETHLDNKLELHGYPREFSQVILNLMSNAKDALIESEIKDKKVIISLFEKEDALTIMIEDNAGGIPKGVIEKIFEPYFTTKKEGEGTGIGLYMSKTIVEDNMAGKLLVSNAKEGAKFSIIFSK